MSTQSVAVSGSPFLSMLQVLFIGLKLTGYISWPWWQVFLPTLIPLGLCGVLFLVFLVIYIGSQLLGR